MKTRRGSKGSSDLFDEMILDNFAGGGGASLGIERALRRAVDLAVNHDRKSVEMHQANHPHTRHLCENIWNVDIKKEIGRRRVGLGWFSPDCRHFSRAKGGKPVKKEIRGLAWIVIKQAKLVRPRVIILENVREFEEWGPLVQATGPDGKPQYTANREPVMMPCKTRKGQTFKRWLAQLRNLGYHVEWRQLNAADYGAPTHRRRLFLIARCDSKPIVWPEPTHGPGRQHPYHTAAECIDWSLPCPSIFLSRIEGRKLGVNRPLAEKTMRRIAMGLKRYVLDNPKPFIVRCAHGDSSAGGGKRWGKGHHDIDQPLPTCTASKDFALINPVIVGVGGRQGQVPPRSVDEPLNTITGKNDKAIAVPFLAQRYGEAPHQETRGQKVDQPLHTVTPKNNSGVLISPLLVQYNQEKGNEVRAQDPEKPLNTVVTENRFAVAAPVLVGAGGPSYSGKPAPADQPIGTVMTENHRALLTAFLAKHYGGVVGHEPDRPLGTVTAVDHHSVIAASLISTSHTGTTGRGRYHDSAEEPLKTITSANDKAVVAAHLTKFRGGSIGSAADEPVPTITSGAGSVRPAGAAHAMGVVAANLIHMNHGVKQWSDVEDPSRTQTTANHAALVYSFLIKYFGCGIGQVLDEPAHTVTTKDRFGLVTVQVDGEPYIIADIGLRMLTPRELARAQGFPDDYILTGTKSNQVARIGNSVCPVMAEVLVRANCSDLARPARRPSRRVKEAA